MEHTRNVLVLCTRNSARSQMAEALLRESAGDRLQIYSAGLQPDRIHPLVAPVMAEVGLDVSGQRSKGVEEYLGRLTAHYLIVVCENAEKNCPKIFPGSGERLYWPFDDPTAVEGSEEDRRAAFRRIRDQIAVRVREWLRELESQGRFSSPLTGPEQVDRSTGNTH